MSFVTFVRDYVQDPDKIISIPNFVFDGCKEIFWYIFSFQWFRNLTYVTLSFPKSNGFHPAGDLSALDQRFIETCKENIANFLGQSTNQIQNFSVLTNNNSLSSTSFELSSASSEQLSFFHNFLYGFFNGISSSFHLCAVTILVIHVLLNENKGKAFKITLASCFGDISYMIAVLFGFRGLIVPWLVLEPLSYVLGFAIQFFFALQIIKDNRRIKAASDRQFDRRSSLISNDSTTPISGFFESGHLSFNRWLVPSLILFSWCEQTQFFQTGGVFSLQPTATLLEMPGLLSTVSPSGTENGISFVRELQILIYLFTFIFTRITFTWFCLSISQNLINWKDTNTFPSAFSFTNLWRFFLKASSSLSTILTHPTRLTDFIKKLPSKLLTPNERQKFFSYIKNSFLQTCGYGISKIVNLFYTLGLWFIPKSLQKAINFAQNKEIGESSSYGRSQFGMPINLSANDSLLTTPSVSSPSAMKTSLSLNKQKGKKIQQLLRDPLAIAAVTCSLAFLPAYSTNLILTKSVGFFPEENRIKHSLFSPWDMPATVLASDMDFISNHPNLAEYPFFLPFYDKGEYGGWLGVAEEDIRYGPFRLWQSRRIRAPWRRTTLQEPALTFANDKSLFINPLHRTPDLKNSSTRAIVANTKSVSKGRQENADDEFADTSGVSISSKQAKLANKFIKQDPNNGKRKDQTANIKGGIFMSPLNNVNGTFEDALGRTELGVAEGQVGLKTVDSQYNKNKWEYLWRRLKAQSAYTKLLAINYVKSLSINLPLATRSVSSSPLPSMKSPMPMLEDAEGIEDFTARASSNAEGKSKSSLVSGSTLDPSLGAETPKASGSVSKGLPMPKAKAQKSKISMPMAKAGASQTNTTAENKISYSGNVGEDAVPDTFYKNANTFDVYAEGKDIEDFNVSNGIENFKKTQNLRITKGGRKKLVEVLKKPLRKLKTSSFFTINRDALAFGMGIDNVAFLSKTPSTQKTINTKFLSIKNFISDVLNPRQALLHTGINQEIQIKNNKQIRKRFKKFKKKLRLFRTRAYKKRNTKIKRLKHFHYLRNKKKRRRKSRRLVYKLRRQYPYIRNAKERKAETFGFYSSAYESSFMPSATRSVSSSSLPSMKSPMPMLEDAEGIEDFTARASSNAEGKSKSSSATKSSMPMPKAKALSSHKSKIQLPVFHEIKTYSPFVEQGLQQPDDTSHKITLQEKTLYSTEYPKNKSFINVKKDFNLIFRTQIGERLDFAQEEIRARIFMNPYVRFLLNNRIDNFISRSDPLDQTSGLGHVNLNKAPETKNSNMYVSDLSSHEQTGFLKMQASPALPSAIKRISPKLTLSKPYKSINKENDLFKRRLIISKYADAVDFLKPSLHHSYADRVYNHQFKGTLSTARRLFSLKIQYDRPLVHTLNYKPAIKHEGLPFSLSSPVLSENNSSIKQIQGVQQRLGTKNNITTPYAEGDHVAGGIEAPFSLPMKNKFIDGANNDQSLLEKGYSAPLYVVWDPQLRKLILTNRYLDYKTVTTSAMKSSMAMLEDAESIKDFTARAMPSASSNGVPLVNPDLEKSKLAMGTKNSNKQAFFLGSNISTLASQQENGLYDNNNLIQFTNWPLKESYFKDNEFLVSQLYSNSQPIDSFLSQENEKARSVALPRRVNSFNTVLNYKNHVQPTQAQRSQQFLKLESNDKKTFLFKHFWNSSKTANELSPTLKDQNTLPKANSMPINSPLVNSSSALPSAKSPSAMNQRFIPEAKLKATPKARSSSASQVPKSLANAEIKQHIPTSAEQRKATRMDEREYPLWMVLKALPPNQGGFLWPGD